MSKVCEKIRELITAKTGPSSQQTCARRAFRCSKSRGFRRIFVSSLGK